MLYARVPPVAVPLLPALCGVRRAGGACAALLSMDPQGAEQPPPPPPTAAVGFPPNPPAHELLGLSRNLNWGGWAFTCAGQVGGGLIEPLQTGGGGASAMVSRSASPSIRLNGALQQKMWG